MRMVSFFVLNVGLKVKNCLQIVKILDEVLEMLGKCCIFAA